MMGGVRACLKMAMREDDFRGAHAPSPVMFGMEAAVFY